MNSPYFNPQSQIRRWAHPIEVKPQEEQCAPMQAIMCTLAGQNQVLCAIKSELDEIYALLQTDRAAHDAGEECGAADCDCET